jgi:hypothetical protein
MVCVPSTSFVVLINCSPLGFFTLSRGLRKECPLSHFLFSLVVEGLRRFILEEKREGSIRGIRTTISINITHFIFVDDILSFGQFTLSEMRHYKRLLGIYYGLVGIKMNMN